MIYRIIKYYKNILIISIIMLQYGNKGSKIIILIGHIKF